MRYSARITTFFDKLAKKVKDSNNQALNHTCALIRKEAIEKMRRRPGKSQPGFPPHNHKTPGLKAIFYDIRGEEGFIGPIKFRGSKFFNRPIPNIHEFGGVAVGVSFGRSAVARYPERSFMYSAVKNLQRKNKLASQFTITFRSNF